MNATVSLFLAGVAGMALGLVFFGGLWLTVKRIPNASRPGLLALGSLIGRMAVALVFFYGLVDGAWPSFAAALVGFFAMRILIVHRMRPQPAQPALYTR